MSRAIIVGSEGQDGRLLTELLRARGDTVLGLSRRAVECSDGSLWRSVNILRREDVAEAVQAFSPDEIYYLAAFHQSSEGRTLLEPTELWQRSFDVHVFGLINFLEAIRRGATNARIFYAASSLVFGRSAHPPQTEETPFSPECIYGISKVAGIQACRFYRRQYGGYAAVGILYNHESTLRAENFVSQKIVRGAFRIKHGEMEELVLGDLSAKVDWGYAPDFVEAMTRILKLAEPDDFIIATGQAHSVGDFVSDAFGSLGLDWRDYVRESKSIPLSVRGQLLGDAGKLRRLTGWTPTVTFEEMVDRMVRGVTV